MAKSSSMTKKATGKKKIMSRGAAAAAFGAAATAAAGAAGAYWFYGTKDAMRHRRQARSWMLHARAEILQRLEEAARRAKKIDLPTYMQIVKTVLDRYSRLRDTTQSELQELSRDTKQAWQHMNGGQLGKSQRSGTVKRSRAKKTARSNYARK